MVSGDAMILFIELAIDPLGVCVLATRKVLACAIIFAVVCRLFSLIIDVIYGSIDENLSKRLESANISRTAFRVLEHSAFLARSIIAAFAAASHGLVFGLVMHVLANMSAILIVSAIIFAKSHGKVNFSSDDDTYNIYDTSRDQSKFRPIIFNDNDNNNNQDDTDDTDGKDD